MKHPQFLLDIGARAPRMRAPMHSNYRKSFVLPGAAALPQGSIPSNRPGVTACARPDARESQDLMR